MAKIVECVPNYSEGRDLAKIEKIVAPFKEDTRIELLSIHYSKDFLKIHLASIYWRWEWEMRW